MSAAVAVAAGARAGAAEWHEWEVTFAVRVTAESAKPVGIRLALPASEELQQVSDVEVEARGMQPTVVPDGDHPHVRLTGGVQDSRRVSLTYRVRRQRQLLAVPPIDPVDIPRRELLPYLGPTPLLQSRSILVREFLETNVAPALARTRTDMMRAILAVTRAEIEHDARGKTLVLDAIRRRRARNIGIERAFATFLRCARIPARFVEGVDLKLSTRHKRVFWTEVWAQDHWWPVSASTGWIGRLPTSWVAVARDGKRPVQVDAGARAAYVVQVRRIDAPKPPRRHRK